MIMLMLRWKEFHLRLDVSFVHFSSHVVTRMNLVDFQDQVQLKA